MRYFVGFLITIGLIVVAFILILHSFSGGSTKSTKTPLVNYANTNTTMQMTIDGPINAQLSHYEVQMTVGENQTQINLFQGYQNTVAKTQSYQSNPSAYAEFLRALDLAGYTEGESGSGVDNDPRGYCPTGYRYSFQILNGSQVTQSYWATSCGGQGTFKGQTDIVKDLYIAQIPNYEDIVSNTGIY
jgi:hypothetical protein